MHCAYMNGLVTAITYRVIRAAVFFSNLECKINTERVEREIAHISLFWSTCFCFFFLFILNANFHTAPVHTRPNEFVIPNINRCFQTNASGD